MCKLYVITYAMKKLTRRYKFEIYPSPLQERQLLQIFGSVRFVKNEFLSMSTAFRESGSHRLLRNEMQELLVDLKEMFPFLQNSPSQSLQVATHDLDVAFQNAKAGLAKQPTWKKRNDSQSFSLPQPKIKNVSGQTCIFIPNYKTHIPMRMHRAFPVGAKLGAATITKTRTGRFYVSVVTNFFSKETLDSQKADVVGLDLNLKEIVLSNGKKIETPQILTTLEKRKRRLQKAMARQTRLGLNILGYDEKILSKASKPEIAKAHKFLKQNRSENYKKNQKRLAKVFEKIKFQKEDFLHKLALSIYRENQSVAMETLNVKGMMRNRRLAKAISFQSWGRLVEIMKMYAIQFDKNLHFISTWFPSSKMCSHPGCGFVNDKLALSDREWICESCGTHHDRDINAAINIKNEGGSCPVYKPVESKASVRRPNGRRTSYATVKQESSRFEVVS